MVYAYKRDKLSDLDKQTRSHDPDASYAIAEFFLAYGWSFSELLSSSTRVMEILRPNLSDGPGDTESINKRRRVDEPGASPSRLDHDFPATSLYGFSMGSIDRAPSSGINDPAESMPRSNSSHPISFDARNGTRDPTDPATMGSLAIETFSPTSTLSPPEELSNLQGSQTATADKQYMNTAEYMQLHQSRPQSCQSHQQPTSKSSVSHPSRNPPQRPQKRDIKSKGTSSPCDLPFTQFQPSQPPTIHADPDFVLPLKRQHFSQQPSFSDDPICTSSFPSNNELSFNKQDRVQHSEIRHYNQDIVGNRSAHTSDYTLAPILSDRHIPYPHPQQRHPADEMMIASLTSHARSPLFHQPPLRGGCVPCPYFPRKHQQPEARHDSERASELPTSFPPPSQ